jgi:Holliday junction DNA helicase RuvA
MIDYLRGTLAAADESSCVIDVGGVGWRVSMSAKSLGSLPQVGEDVQVWCVMSMGESSVSLSGFATPQERDMFTRLVGVKGIGTKVALSILSVLDPASLADAIAEEDDRRIARAPGVGKKSAQRIILELKGTLGEQPGLFGAAGEPGDAPQAGSAASEAATALLGMGFTSAEIDVALKGYEGSQSDPAEAIKYALHRLGAAG